VEGLNEKHRLRSEADASADRRRAANNRLLPPQPGAEEKLGAPQTCDCHERLSHTIGEPQSGPLRRMRF
jgi:hypothetical protein